MKFGRIAVLLVAGCMAQGALACDGTSAAQTQMDRFRVEAQAQIQAENRASLRRNLLDTQMAFQESMRGRFLAGRPGPGTSGPSAKSAP